METANMVSICSAIFAGLSALFAYVAVRYSNKSLAFAVESASKNHLENLERIRLELLDDITENIIILDRSRLQIGAMKASRDAEDTIVQQFIGDYYGIFTKNYPSIINALKNHEELWEKVKNSKLEYSYQDLLLERARLRKQFKQLEIQMQSIQIVIDDFPKALNIARMKCGLPPR